MCRSKLQPWKTTQNRAFLWPTLFPDHWSKDRSNAGQIFQAGREHQNFIHLLEHRNFIHLSQGAGHEIEQSARPEIAHSDGPESAQPSGLDWLEISSVQWSRQIFHSWTLPVPFYHCQCTVWYGGLLWLPCQGSLRGHCRSGLSASNRLLTVKRTSNQKWNNQSNFSV